MGYKGFTLSWGLSQLRSACKGNTGDSEFDPWVWKFPWRRSGKRAPLFLPGESMDKEHSETLISRVTKLDPMELGHECGGDSVALIFVFFVRVNLQVFPCVNYICQFLHLQMSRLDYTRRFSQLSDPHACTQVYCFVNWHSTGSSEYYSDRGVQIFCALVILQLWCPAYWLHIFVVLAGSA